MLIRAILFLSAFLPFTSFAAGVQSSAEARALSDKASILFKDEKFAKGFALLKPNWPIPTVEVDSVVNQINMQWPIVRQRFGTAVGIEFAKEETIGNSFIRYTYIHKFQNHAIKWVFVFYEPKDEWLVNAVSYDDQYQTLFR